MEWTDRRMDDFAKRVDDGFNEVKGDIAKLDAKIDRLDTKFDAKFDQLDTKLDAKFDQLDTKFDAKFDRVDSKIGGLQTLLFRYALGTSTAIVAGVALIAVRALTGG